MKSAVERIQNPNFKKAQMEQPIKDKAKADTTKHIKILVDICMVALMIALFPTGYIYSLLDLHILFGYIIAPVVIIHLLLNGKWLVNSTKRLFSGKLSPKAWYMYKLVIGLAVAFSVCIITGFILVIDPNPAHQIHRFHHLSALISLILVVYHVKVHWGYLKSYFSGKKAQAIQKINEA